ncbi:MAG: BREX system Lon protease-like protein BrxL [Clostridiales bacterium]|nr:BREX system Lon protease-like protein BrxL [Clostridiales bacterium]
MAMESFEIKARDYFGEIVINKSLIHKAGFGSRAIPTYVAEWIIAHFVGDDMELNEESRGKIARFVQKYIPSKGEKEAIKNDLFEQREVQMLDNYSVSVNLVKGDRYLNIPLLDENQGHISPQIIQDNEMLLSSGLWGVGTLFYIPPTEENKKGQIWLKEFKPFQLANVDIEYFCETRSIFSTEEWLNLIVSSMGFNHRLYTERQKCLLVCRLIPLVEPRYNLVEPAPKGTGKSFVFDNMSRYVAVRSGAISPAVLFFHDGRKTPGLITRYDCVVIDEAQKVKADPSGELTALLKSYLESGRFGRGASGTISADAGLVLLANIDIDEKRRPVNEEIGLFRSFPNFLRETAFIDRFSGLLPGWELPRISKETPSNSLGFKGDIFGEILHLLRSDISYRDYVKMNIELFHCEDMRDAKAIEAGASGMLKILFPNKQPSEEEFYKFCVNPALELRQRVRDELCKLDREYVPVTIHSKWPDDFQKNHKLPVFTPPDEIEGEENLLNNKFENVLDEDIGIQEENKVEERIIQIYTELQAKEVASLLDEKREPKELTIIIEEGAKGISYKRLFSPYLRRAKNIRVVDPYIRLDYQIKNFIAFCGVIDSAANRVAVKLVTSAENKSFEEEVSLKFEEMKKSLAQEGIDFSYEFDDKIHDRLIETDSGWRIKPGRGLDIFQKPKTWYGFEELDQTKRKCRATEIDYIKILS